MEANFRPHITCGPTLSVDAEVPVCLQWSAWGHSEVETPNVVDDDDCKHYPSGSVYPLELENANVEQEDGNLRECEADLIED